MIPGEAAANREPHTSEVRYPGGLRARYEWIGPREGDGAERSGRLCRAWLAVEGPAGSWSAAFDSSIFDEPQGLYWDTPGLLAIKFGFGVHAFDGRSGEERWVHDSPTPIICVLGSPRLPHLLVQSELETVALGEDGQIVWRVAHSDVVVEAALIGRRLVLTGYGGPFPPMDPLSGTELR